jgi:hypothetical protein
MPSPQPEHSARSDAGSCGDHPHRPMPQVRMVRALLPWPNGCRCYFHTVYSMHDNSSLEPIEMSEVLPGPKRPIEPSLESGSEPVGAASQHLGDSLIKQFVLRILHKPKVWLGINIRVRRV